MNATRERSSCSTQILPLGHLGKGQKGMILRLDPDFFGTPRLMEMGFVEGSLVEIVHEAPYGRDPIAVRVRGSLIALRRQEANCVEVQLHEAL